MFGKKCSKCNAKVKADHKFCHSCGMDLGNNYDKEDYGILGRNDFDESMDFSDRFMEKIFNSAMRILDSQMKNLNREIVDRKGPRQRNTPALNVQFFVNGERIFSDNGILNKPIKKVNTISKDKLKKFSDLPKEEPKYKMRRISDKVIYELIVPGVNNIEDVLILPLENSLEIKALSKDKVYSKNLNLNLPVLRYQLVNDSLIIEMQAK